VATRTERYFCWCVPCDCACLAASLVPVFIYCSFSHFTEPEIIFHCFL